MLARHELLERLPLAEILCVKGKNEVKVAEVREYLDSKLSNLDLHEVIEEYGNTRFRSVKKEREFLEQYDLPVQPVTEQLIYRYDYGDGWEVLIECENAYKRDETGKWKDTNGETPDAAVDNLEARENILGWADMMGWTGRKISPKQTL